MYAFFVSFKIGGELAYDDRVYTGQIVAGSVYCTVNESSTQCHTNYTVVSDCLSPARAARVRCYYQSRSTLSK